MYVIWVNWSDLERGSEHQSYCCQICAQTCLPYLSVHEFLAKSQTTAISNPLYWSDSAPCDFFIFSKYKSVLKVRWFNHITMTEAEWWETLAVPNSEFQEMLKMVVRLLGSLHTVPRRLLWMGQCPLEGKCCYEEKNSALQLFDYTTHIQYWEKL